MLDMLCQVRDERRRERPRGKDVIAMKKENIEQMEERREEEIESGGTYAWKCSVCGYIERGYPEGLPDDYRCPECGAKPKKFERVRIG